MERRQYMLLNVVEACSEGFPLLYDEYKNTVLHFFLFMYI